MGVVNNLERKSTMSTQQLQLVTSEMGKRQKSVGVSYLLWFFLGGLGLHKFYLGNTAWGLAYLIVTLLGIIIGFLTLGIGFIILAIFPGLALLYDLFTLPSQARAANEQVEAYILDEVAATSSESN